MRAFYLTCAVFITSSAVLAEPHGDDAVVVEPDQAIVQVNGIVCSFCAYGTEKNLAELSFLDKSQFRDDGVLIDIQSHRVTLALLADQKFDIAQVYTSIKRGGYDPVSFYLNVHGKVRKSDDRYWLTSPASGQVFEILGSGAERYVDQGLVTVTGQVDADRIPGIEDGQPIPVVLGPDS